MIININIDIELNKEQVSFLRKFYIDKSTRQFHISSKSGWRASPDNIIADSLVYRDILKKDHIMNYTLTILGHYIIDKIDRDKIINSIIN